MENHLSREEDRYIRECLAGNSDSFEFLVHKYEQGLFRMAVRMVGNQEDARDLVQEAFLRAYHALASYRFEYAFSTWLYRILINLCLNFSAKQHRAVPLCEEIEDKAPALPKLECAEFWEEISRALSYLLPLERSAFLLATFEKLSVTEIGQILDHPKGTVCWLLFQARKKLQAALSKSFMEAL